jgi:hypothetical protein
MGDPADRLYSILSYKLWRKDYVTKKNDYKFFIFICLIGFSFGQSSTKVGVGVAIIDLYQIFEVQVSEGGYWNGER